MELFDEAVRAEVITANRGHWYHFDGVNLGHGRRNALESISTSGELLQRVALAVEAAVDHSR